ncbi:MAG TPA: hypothetical protein VEP90_10945, partial [Methylomirabilota bacterium]|nr:hypothetical protein [Methylomirabilota bacterium]
QSQVKLQELKDTQVSKERVESQLKDRLFEIQRNSSSLRSGTGRSPLEALHRLQNVLGSIIDYLGEYRRRREGERLYDPLELERITQRFGEHVDMVHKTLNRVIAQRCPVMYKNRETGPVRLTVQDYDFLRGEQFIPELLRGEWAGGGGDSAMTVLGLATRSSGSHIGTILLVDEFNDAETFKKIVCDDLATLDQLAYAIFVKQDPELKELKFEVMK